MKKLIVSLSLIICILYIPTTLLAIGPSFNAKGGIPFEYTPQEGSIEELYKDIIVTQLEPLISAEIERQYGKPLLYDLYDVSFLNIDRKAYRSFSFIIKVKVSPFVGAHNTIGVDHMTISISPYGNKIDSFEHIKSFPLPPHLESYYKDLKLK